MIGNESNLYGKKCKKIVNDNKADLPKYNKAQNENKLYSKNWDKISINDKLYPEKLKKIKNPPLELYVIGDKNILNSNCLSVVGARKNTEYGEKYCKIFTKELIKYNLIIVSGMAKGIDTIAHTTTILNKGKTIAVLPCGFQNIYPKENMSLYKKIIENGGCVITEYKPVEKADSAKFLERNRIVSGLSIATLVIEASLRSGTSVTARYAKEQQRDVFCIPGSLENPKSQGTNKLIKEFAKLVTKPEDITKNYKFLTQIETNIDDDNINGQKTNLAEEIPITYRKIYNQIKNIKIDINEIARKSNTPLKEVMAKLLVLELDGKIKKLPGNMYIRSEKT